MATFRRPNTTGGAKFTREPKAPGGGFTTQASGGGNRFHPPNHPPAHHGGGGTGYHVPGGVRPLGGGNGPSFSTANGGTPNFGRVGAQQVNPNGFAGSLPNLGTLNRGPVTPELVSTDLPGIEALRSQIINRGDAQTRQARQMITARAGGNLNAGSRLGYLAAERNVNPDLAALDLSMADRVKAIEGANANRTNQANQFNVGIEGEDFRVNSGNSLAVAGLDQANQGRAAGIAQGNQSANLSAAQANARLREAEWGAGFQRDRASRGDFESDRGFEESQRRYDTDREDRLDLIDNPRGFRRPRRSRPRFTRQGGGGNPTSPVAGRPSMGGGGGMVRAKRGGGIGGGGAADKVALARLTAELRGVGKSPYGSRGGVANMSPEDKMALEAAIGAEGARLNTKASNFTGGFSQKHKDLKAAQHYLNAGSDREREAIRNANSGINRLKRDAFQDGVGSGYGPGGASHPMFDQFFGTTKNTPLSPREAKTADKMGVPADWSPAQVRNFMRSRTVSGSAGGPTSGGKTGKMSRGEQGGGGVGHGGRFAPGLNEANAAAGEMVEYQGRIMPREVARRTKEGNDFSAWLEIQRQLAAQAEGQGDGMMAAVGETGSQYDGPPVSGANRQRRGPWA